MAYTKVIYFYMAITFAQLLTKLRFSHLRLLVAIEAGGSLRAAAQELNLTQPALSKTLKELEGALGLPLFVRTPKGLRLTAQCRVLTRGAAVLMRELMHVMDETRAAAAEPVAILRVGAPPFVALGYAPRLLKAMLAKSSPVQIELHEGNSPHLLDSLLEGQLDALIGTYSRQMQDPGRMHGFRYEKLYDETYDVIVGTAHPLVRRRNVGWADLLGEAWILPPREALIRDITDAAFLRAGVIPPVPKITSSSPLTNISLAATGLGLTVVPSSTVAESAHGRAVGKVRVRPSIPASSVSMMYRTSAELHARITSLREAIASLEQ
jgi:LysR family transcriptional regulator of abg operon